MTIEQTVRDLLTLAEKVGIVEWGQTWNPKRLTKEDVTIDYFRTENLAPLVSLLRDRIAEMQRLPEGWRARWQNGYHEIFQDEFGHFALYYKDRLLGVHDTLTDAIAAAERIRGEAT